MSPHSISVSIFENGSYKVNHFVQIFKTIKRVASGFLSGFFNPKKALNKGDTQKAMTVLQHNKLALNAQGHERHTALTAACTAGHLSIVESLLQQKGIDINAPNAGGDSPLMCACREGHLDVVELLLKQKQINVNLKGRFGEFLFPLREACKQNKNALFDLLVKSQGINSQTCLDTFVEACEAGDMNIIKFLLSKSDNLFDINGQNSNGKTALMTACQYNRTDVVEFLLEQKNINING